ncbi:ABC transporter ATP-binding protein [Paenibacillus athensensis]|uniref:Multidrug ABC transporter permease n=1 Tax=Paenibacillus athensensis TaxID=1967502 RepID=A0A4Y8Q8M9_9BACL|nr:ABC transporter ATP-binding protein [Paenibacillus athensensis]MCD1260061.1 ABC transporter ATP-binding protein [Paenibacillus athensensis]
MHTGKRLFHYAALFKKPILLALLLLAGAVAAELAGPFVAKTVIDRNILGIELPWYAVQQATESEDAVAYQGGWYKRSDHFAPGEERGAELRILQSGRRFVLVPQAITFDGERSYADGQLTITYGDRTAVYPAKELSAGELYAFYKPEFKPLLLIAGMFFALTIIGAALTYGQRYLLQVAANRVIQRMRMDVYKHIQRLPIPYFDNQPAGSVVSRVTNDTEAVRDLYVQVLANFFTGVVYMAGILIALFVLDYRLALFTLPIVPILFAWVVLYRKYATRYNQEIRERVSQINGMLNEAIQGMPIIRAFRRQKETQREFDALNDEYTLYQNKMLSLNSITSHNLMNVIRNLFFFGLILLVGGGWMAGGAAAITIGALYAYIDYMNRMFQPMVGIVNQLSNMERAIVAADRVFTLLDEPGTDVADSRMERYRGDVTFEQVSFAYKEDEYVLRQISFEARHGETVALVGHTGSGKSSILNLLFRFYDANQGRVLIDGRDITGIPKQQLRSHMGIVLQDPFLFTGTIASNVSLNDPAISRAQVERALSDVGAAEMFRHLPRGIDEPVLEKGSTLSAGQRQLISFARALAFDPAVLILDEATASIDTETEAVIQEALDVLKKGRTTFIIAHRLSTIKNADLILVLDRGEIVERGAHDELMSRRGRYFQMYQLQQGLTQQSGTPAQSPSA